VVWADPPDAPGEPEAQEVGNDFVSLTWQKPRSDGGGRIVGYYVEKKDADSDNWARINQAPTPATIFNVPNLIEEREYDFRVFAVNEAGESKPATTGRRILVKDPKGPTARPACLLPPLSLSLSRSLSLFLSLSGRIAVLRRCGLLFTDRVA